MISARIDFLAVFRRRPDKRDLAVPVLVVVIPVPHSFFDSVLKKGFYMSLELLMSFQCLQINYV